jgi:uncharacterized protein YkwD
LSTRPPIYGGDTFRRSAACGVVISASIGTSVTPLPAPITLRISISRRAVAGGRSSVVTKRQLKHLYAVSEETAQGRRLHGLGAMAIDELVEDAGEVETDQRSRDQLAKVDTRMVPAPARDF